MTEEKPNNDAQALAGQQESAPPAPTPEQQAAAAEKAKVDADEKAKADAAALEAEKAKAAQDEADAAKGLADKEAEAMRVRDANLRTDGPTLEEFVAAGEDPAMYPPRGFAAVTDQTRAEANPQHPISRIWLLEQRVADLERRFKALHL